MEKGSYPELAASIQLGSVEAIRKSMLDLKDSFSLFDVSLRSFKFTPDPESRVRMGIAISQLSATKKHITIIGCGSERGEMPNPSHAVVVEIAKLAVEKGFAWVEYTPSFDAQTVKGMRESTVRTGSRLLLRVDPHIHPLPQITGALWGCDGVKVSIDIENVRDLDLLIETLDRLSKDAPMTTVFVRPKGRYGGLVQSMVGTLKASVACLDPELSPEREPRSEPQAYPEFTHKVARVHMGLTEATKDRPFSLAGRILTSPVKMAFLLGSPVDRSLVPLLHNKAFKDEGSDSFMVPVVCGMESLDSGVGLLRDMGAIGASITLPIRSLIGSKLDRVEPHAKRIGVVNTIKAEGGRLIGYNTEYTAAMDLLGRHAKGDPPSVLIVGTGGAGRSIAAAASDMGFKTYICGSNLERTTKVSRSLGSGIGTVPLQSVTRMKGKVSVLVNATPGSLAKMEGRTETKMSVSEIARFLEPSVGIDLVYSSSWTSFLSSVESRGGAPISGFEMLVAEVVEAHKLWTGTGPDIESLKSCAIEAYPLLNAD